MLGDIYPDLCSSNSPVCERFSHHSLEAEFQRLSGHRARGLHYHPIGPGDDADPNARGYGLALDLAANVAECDGKERTGRQRQIRPLSLTEIGRKNAAQLDEVGVAGFGVLARVVVAGLESRGEGLEQGSGPLGREGRVSDGEARLACSRGFVGTRAVVAGARVCLKCFTAVSRPNTPFA